MAGKTAASRSLRTARAARRPSASPFGTAEVSSPRLAAAAGGAAADLATLIEAERAALLQAHSLMRCLQEVLSDAPCGEALFYADVAGVAARIVDESVARLDATNIMPRIEALRRPAPSRSAGRRVASERLEVREAAPIYPRRRSSPSCGAVHHRRCGISTSRSFSPRLSWSRA